MVEPEDEPHYLGRVTKVDHRRHLVEVACKAYESAGTQGWITPSFNKQLYATKRSTLASIASGDARSLLLAQLLTDPTAVYAPEVAPRSDWLTPGMHSNPAQDRAIGIMVALDPGQAALIQGPPGTGKTTVIVEAIKHRLAERPQQRILVCSHSNLAVDNALERLAGTQGLRAVRVAKAERVHPAVDAFRVEDEDDDRLITANVFFATCATAATSSITTDEVYDMVILDEANKARIDEALPCLRLGAAVVMVGDHKQLPPVEDDAIYQIVEDHPELEEIVDTSLFERCWDKGVPDQARCLLVEQHRMHPEISGYISSASYDNQLENAPEVLEYEYVTRRPFPVALHMVDTAGLRGGRERRGAGGALRNDAEVRVCAQVVRILDERADPEPLAGGDSHVRGPGGSPAPGAEPSPLPAPGADRHRGFLRGARRGPGGDFAGAQQRTWPDRVPAGPQPPQRGDFASPAPGCLRGRRRHSPGRRGDHVRPPGRGGQGLRRLPDGDRPTRRPRQRQVPARPSGPRRGTGNCPGG